MPKEDIRNHKEVEYVVLPQKDKTFVYKVTNGLEPFEIKGDNKRSLTAQMKREIEKRLEETKEKENIIEPEDDEEVYTPEEESEVFSFDAFPIDSQSEEKEEKKEDTLEVPLEKEKVKKEVPKQETEVVEEIPEEEEELEEPVMEKEVVEKPKEISPPPKEIYPKFAPRILEMEFVIAEGQLFGKVMNETYVTIKDNVFVLIQPTVYYSKIKGQNRRKMNIRIPDIPLPELDTELLFRFLVHGQMWSLRRGIPKTYKLGKSKGSLVIITNDYDEDIPMFVMTSKIMATSDFNIAFFGQEAMDDELKPVVKHNYVPDKDLVSFNDNLDVVFDKKNIERMKVIIGKRKYRTFVGVSRQGYCFQDILSGNYILCGGGNANDEEEEEFEENIEE